MKRSELKQYIKEEILSTLNEATKEDVETTKELTAAVKDLGNAKKEAGLDESVNEAKEPEVITQLRKIVKNKQNDLIKDTKSGKKVRVDMNSANLMVQVYDALKQQSNKDKFVKGGVVSMSHMADKLMRKESVNETKVETERYFGSEGEANAYVNKRNRELNEEEDKEPSKAELKKTKGLAKAKDELALLTREMKSLARKYKKAEGVEKDKLVDELKKKTKLKKELEAIVNKA